MNKLHALTLAALAFAMSPLAVHAAGTDVHVTTPAVLLAQAAQPGADMADGEVRKVDKENNKITLKHGEIKNLDMPGMTMVFQVKDPAMLEKVKPGDKVKFTAEKAGTAIVVTTMETAK